MKVRAVILAAGSGTRLSPITPFVPKEMLPICGFPAIHHALYELAEAGVNELLVITSDGKDAVVRYLTQSISPKGEDATRLTLERDRLLGRLKIDFARQRVLRGTANAILLARDFMGENPLLVLYPDDLLTVAHNLSDGISATSRLIVLSEQTGCSAVLVGEIPGRLASGYGVLSLSGEGLTRKVVGIEEKPTDFKGDRAYALIGRMVLTPTAIRSISRFDLGDDKGIVPTLDHEAKNERLYAEIYRGARYDIGSHVGYAETLRALQ